MTLTAATRGMDAADLKGYRDVIVGDLVQGARSEIIGFDRR